MKNWSKYIYIFRFKDYNIYDNIIVLMFLHLLGNLLFMGNNQWLGSVICLYAILQMIICLIKKSRCRYPFSGLIGVLFYLYLLLSIFCVIIPSYFRGEAPWGNEFLSFLSYHFVVTEFYLAFFLPFLILFGCKRFFSFSLFLRISIVAAYVGCICFIIDLPHLLSHVSISNDKSSFLWKNYTTFFDAIAFSLFLLPILQNRKRYIPVIIMGILVLFITVICARRGASLTIAIIFFFVACLFSFHIQVKFKPIYWLILIGIAVSGYLFYYFKSDSLFRQITQKGMYDNREIVNSYFEKDMFNSFDIWFGRGLNGLYYCPQRYAAGGGKFDYITYRRSIETGFYHLILKGGIFFACLHVLILLGAVYRGLFCSKNRVLKAFALWILLSLIELYPFGWPYFSLKFLFVWIGTCFCYDKQYLNMSDMKICSLLNIR